MIQGAQSVHTTGGGPEGVTVEPCQQPTERGDGRNCAGQAEPLEEMGVEFRGDPADLRQGGRSAQHGDQAQRQQGAEPVAAASSVPWIGNAVEEFDQGGQSRQVGGRTRQMDALAVADQGVDRERWHANAVPVLIDWLRQPRSSGIAFVVLNQAACSALTLQAYRLISRSENALALPPPATPSRTPDTPTITTAPPGDSRGRHTPGPPGQLPTAWSGHLQGPSTSWRGGRCWRASGTGEPGVCW
jgi:hypothetical protein